MQITGNPCFTSTSQLLLLLLLLAFARLTVVAPETVGQQLTNGRCAGLPNLTVCDPTQGGLCLNESCVSACSLRKMLQCVCPSEDDNYCYLCCGSADKACQPAHVYSIYKENGETWERDTCRRCRNDLQEGAACDDKSDRRICMNKKCTANACLDQAQGAYCDRHKSRVCVDGDCRDPCREHSSALRVCECESFKNRCELCCHDYKSSQCESAFRKYGIRNKDGRPINRIGLSCSRRHDQCNVFGRCSALGGQRVVSLTTCVSMLVVSLCWTMAYSSLP